jgi:hypothetical protein
VVILVDELSTAMRDYADLGFTVTPGGEHKGLGTHNALIPLADGAYLELIAFRQRSFPRGTVIHKEVRGRQLSLSATARTPAERRMLAWEICGEGLVDFALLPRDIEADLKAARSRGLAMEGPLPGSRLRPDGQKVAWQFGIPATWDLPFLCADVTARSLRVPEGAAREHPNGATGVARIAVAVNDVRDSASRYEALLGVPRSTKLERGVPSQRGTEPQTVEFALGSTTIALIAAVGAETAVRHRLATRGEGPCALVLRQKNKAAPSLLDPPRSHGARIEWMTE